METAVKSKALESTSFLFDSKKGKNMDKIAA